MGRATGLAGRGLGRYWFPIAAGASIAAALSALLSPDGDLPTAGELVRFTVIAAWALAGLVIGLRTPTGQLGPLVIGASLVGAGTALFDTLAHQGAGAGSSSLARLGLGVMPAVAFHLLVALPDGRLGTNQRRMVVAAGYVVGAVVGLASSRSGIAVSPWPIAGCWSVALAVGLVLSNARYRKAEPIERRRMQWVGWAILVVTEIVLVLIALQLMTDRPNQLTPWALGATMLFPAALTAGTYGGLMARVDRLITHTVSLAGLTALVIAFYVLVVVALGRGLSPGERPLLLLSMAAAALAALAYQPARDWLHDTANRLVYGETIAPEEALRTFGNRLTRAIPLDELLLQMVESLRKSMNLTSAECWTGSNGRYDIAASVPHHAKPSLSLGDKELGVVCRAGVSGPTWLGIWLPSLLGPDDQAAIRVAPMVHSGQLLGLVVVTRRQGEEFSAEEDRVLSELAREVGLALHNAQLDSALQASLEELRQANSQLVESRRRVVTAGDEERRKLERNLHDGAQQYLVAMAVKLRLTEDLFEEDPAEALDLIGELRANMQDAIGELRALAHGIFPPLLSSGGLAEALPAAVSRSALPAVLDCQTSARYDPEVEAGVYFCCMEALQNAAKHAGPEATVVVRLGRRNDVLSFEVSDDGVGFAAGGNGVGAGEGGAGHGFVNMTDRLGAIGGRLTVTSTPGGGTTIRGDIPIAASPADADPSPDAPDPRLSEVHAAAPTPEAGSDPPGEAAVPNDPDRSELDVDRLAQNPQ